MIPRKRQVLRFITLNKIQTKQYICRIFLWKFKYQPNFCLAWYPEKTEITRHWWGFFIIYKHSKFKKEPAVTILVKFILTIKNIKIHYLHLRVCQPGWCHASDIEKSYWGIFFFQISKISPHTCVNTEGFPCSSIFSSSSSFTFRPWISSCRWIRPLHLFKKKKEYIIIHLI